MTESWRAKMPKVYPGTFEWECEASDVEELVARVNAELDAKDARIAKLEGFKRSTLALFENPKLLAEAAPELASIWNTRWRAVFRTLIDEDLWKPIEDLAELLQSSDGLEKHGRQGWKSVDLTDHVCSLVRHTCGGVAIDADSGKPHYLHALARLLMIIQKVRTWPL